MSGRTQSVNLEALGDTWPVSVHVDQEYLWIGGQSERLERAHKDGDDPTSVMLEEAVMVFLRSIIA